MLLLVLVSLVSANLINLATFGLVFDDATSCVGASTPGAKALEKVLMNHLGELFSNAHTYACRNAVGGSSFSEHAAGRAVDFMVHREGTVEVQRVADWLIANAADLGLQSVIYARKVWGYRRSSYRSGQWRNYCSGNSCGPGRKSPHDDHIHVGINLQASRELTEEMVESTIRAHPFNGEASTTLSPGVWRYQVAARATLAEAKALAATNSALMVDPRQEGSRWFLVRSVSSFVTSGDALAEARRLGFEEFLPVEMPAGWIASAAPTSEEPVEPRLQLASASISRGGFVYQVASYNSQRRASRHRLTSDVSIQPSDNRFRIRSVERFATDDLAQAAARARGHSNFVTFQVPN